MIEKRAAGDQQRLRELEAIIAALEAIPNATDAAPADASNTKS